MMDDSYKIDSRFILDRGQAKDKIVLCNSYSYGVDHMLGWKKKPDQGLYPITAYSVTQDGEVYEHFKPNLTHTFISETVDSKIIGITMANIGHLALNPYNGVFTNWLNDIHHPDNVFFKEWRGYKYWESYTDEQLDSVYQLVTYLLNEYNIPKHVVEHNTKIDGAEYVSGVLYRSNFNKNYLDPSPAWDFDRFKNRISNNTEYETAVTE